MFKRKVGININKNIFTIFLISRSTIFIFTHKLFSVQKENYDRKRKFDILRCFTNWNVGKQRNLEILDILIASALVAHVFVILKIVELEMF